MKRMLALGLAGLIVVALAAYAVTYNTSPAVVVTDGSIMGVIEGNFSSISSTHPLLSFFNATTYMNQTGHPASTLSIVVQAFTYGMKGGSLTVKATVMVLGRFVENLHPSDLVLETNASAITNYPYEIAIQSWGIFQAGTNVSYNPQQGVGILGTGSGALTATLVNQTQAGSIYVFSYQNEFVILEDFQYAHFVGFQATVGGLDAPSRVSALIRIVNSP